MRTLAVLVAAAIFAACGSDSAPDLSHACARVTKSGTIPTCTQLFTGRVGLKLPTGSSAHPYGVWDRRGSLVTADGTRIPIKRPPFNPGAPRDTGYASTVYRGTVSKRMVTALTPVLRVSENAILTHTFGSRVLAGTISVRKPDGTYDLDHMVPIIITLAAKARHRALRGTIANARTSVRLAHGACIKALNSSDGNPLVDGFTSRIALVRVPSMHAPFNDEMVLEWDESSSGMGDAFYPSLATVVGRDRLGKTWEVAQHGTPDSGPALKLHVVAGPIETGTC